MIPPKKATIGIRPVSKMFRLDALGGQLVDALFEARGTGVLSEDYFETVAEGDEVWLVRNEKSGTSLTCTRSDIIFTRSRYSNDKQFRFEDFLAEFRVVWKVVNSVLHIKDIRRIGYVCEYRFENTDPSGTLFSSLLRLPRARNAKKFNLQFEEHLPTKEGLVPDVRKSDFINIIRGYYDSELDSEVSVKGAINANLDVQRYYAPVFNGNVGDEVSLLFRRYEDEAKTFLDEAKSLGLVTNAFKENS